MARRTLSLVFIVCSCIAFVSAVDSPANAFWHNLNTGNSQESRPDCLPWKDSKTGRGYWILDGKAVWDPPVQYAWRAVNTTEKPPRTFYENFKSNDTQWIRPDEMAWIYLDRDKPYFFNIITNETTSIVPPEVGYSDAERNATYYVNAQGNPTWEPPLDARWVKAFDAKRKRDYFFNSVTNETVWTLPAASNLAWQRWFSPATDPYHVDL